MVSTAPRRRSIQGTWTSRLAFVLALSGSAVGLGNIWKFPYIAGVNGGGAFVLVYLVCVFAVGLPIMMSGDPDRPQGPAQSRRDHGGTGGTGDRQQELVCYGTDRHRRQLHHPVVLQCCGGLGSGLHFRERVRGVLRGKSRSHCRGLRRIDRELGHVRVLAYRVHGHDCLRRGQGRGAGARAGSSDSDAGPAGCCCCSCWATASSRGTSSRDWYSCSARGSET